MDMINQLFCVNFSPFSIGALIYFRSHRQWGRGEEGGGKAESWHHLGKSTHPPPPLPGRRGGELWNKGGISVIDKLKVVKL